MVFGLYHLALIPKQCAVNNLHILSLPLILSHCLILMCCALEFINYKIELCPGKSEFKRQLSLINLLFLLMLFYVFVFL